MLLKWLGRNPDDLIQDAEIGWDDTSTISYGAASARRIVQRRQDERGVIRGKRNVFEDSARFKIVE